MALPDDLRVLIELSLSLGIRGFLKLHASTSEELKEIGWPCHNRGACAFAVYSSYRDVVFAETISYKIHSR